MSEKISYHCGGRGAGGGGAGGGGAGGGGGEEAVVAGTGVVRSSAQALARFKARKFSKNATNIRVWKNSRGEMSVSWVNKKSGLGHSGSYSLGTGSFSYV